MLTKPQLEFLFKLLNTQGIAFPLAECAIAAETNTALQELLKVPPVLLPA